MKRLTFFVTFLVLAGLVLVVPVSGAMAETQDRPCQIPWWNGTWQRKQLIKCELQRIDPPGTFQYVLGIARCESGEDLMDTYWRDGYAGPFQQSTKYWKTRFHSYQTKWDRDLVPKVGNFRTNTIISFRMARAKGTWQIDWACA